MQRFTEGGAACVVISVVVVAQPLQHRRQVNADPFEGLPAGKIIERGAKLVIVLEVCAIGPKSPIREMVVNDDMLCHLRTHLQPIQSGAPGPNKNPLLMHQLSNTSDGVSDVVMAARHVADAIATRRADPALQADDLRARGSTMAPIFNKGQQVVIEI